MGRSTSPKMSRFRTPSAAAGQEHSIVRLRFIGPTEEGDSLYCHKLTLSQWFGVLKGALETDGSGTTGKCSSSSGVAATAATQNDELYQTIAMHDDDIGVLEQALNFMYPTLPLPTVTWDNAEGLLLLADKYDGPVLKEMVASFLRSNLAGVLTADSCFHWLKVTSAVGLADLATTCIGFIVQNTLPITRDMLAVLHKQQATELCVALRDALSASLAERVTLESELVKERSRAAEAGRLLEEVSRLGRELGTSAQPSGGYCSSCRYTLFTKPNGKRAMYCLNCGKHC